MTSYSNSPSQRIAWIEGIRILAAIAFVPYHAQLLFTNYAFTPQPTGIASNFTALVEASSRLGGLSGFSVPLWFGYQFVDVFVLISGFSLVLSLRSRSIDPLQFIRQRFFRILWPFWTVAWLSYPILWAIGTATNSYIPDRWHIFAGASFPLLFEYASDLLLPTSGPWWSIPLILSFAIVFPFLCYLQARWGDRNLLIMSVIVTIVYRLLGVFAFGGHPTYVALDTPSSWLPFVSFMAKLSTFVVGMVVARAYQAGHGPVFWSAGRALRYGIGFYVVGFICQFYWAGWIVADLLLPIGLLLGAMVIFRVLAQNRQLAAAMVWLGAHSYSYFLIHNFVVDRTTHLVIGVSVTRFWLLLPVMILGTLVLAVLADAITPLIKRVVAAIGRDLDYVLSKSKPRSRIWQPKVGDRVRYRGEAGWAILKVEQLLDDQSYYLCQIWDGHRTMWQSEDELALDRNFPEDDRSPARSNHAPNPFDPKYPFESGE